MQKKQQAATDQPITTRTAMTMPAIAPAFVESPELFDGYLVHDALWRVCVCVKMHSDSDVAVFVATVT